MQLQCSQPPTHMKAYDQAIDRLCATATATASRRGQNFLTLNPNLKYPNLLLKYRNLIYQNPLLKYPNPIYPIAISGMISRKLNLARKIQVYTLVSKNSEIPNIFNNQDPRYVPLFPTRNLGTLKPIQTQRPPPLRLLPTLSTHSAADQVKAQIKIPTHCRPQPAAAEHRSPSSPY